MRCNEKVKRILMLAVMSVALLMINKITVSAFDTGTGIVTVPKEKKYVVAVSNIQRTGDYSYVMTKANSVYPIEEGASDNFTKCKARWYCDDKKTEITDEVTLTEGKLAKVTVLEGYISRNDVVLMFAGNNAKYAAYIAYYYNGK